MRDKVTTEECGGGEWELRRTYKNKTKIKSYENNERRTGNIKE